MLNIMFFIVLFSMMHHSYAYRLDTTTTHFLVAKQASPDPLQPNVKIKPIKKGKRIHSHPLPTTGIKHKHTHSDCKKTTTKRAISHSHNGRVHSHLLPKKGLNHSHTAHIPKGQFRTGYIETLGFSDVINIKGNKITSYSRRSGEKKFRSTTYLLKKKEIYILEQILTAIGAEKWKPFYNHHLALNVGHKWAFNYQSSALNIKSAGFHQTPVGYSKLFTYVFDTLTRNKDPIKPTYAIDGSFSMGGMRGYESITIQNKTLTYTKTRRGSKITSKVYYLSNTDISQLEKNLVEKETQKWMKLYNCRSSLRDGTSWSLQYKSKRLNIDSAGRNCYPNHYKEVADYLLKAIMKGKHFRGQ